LAFSRVAVAPTMRSKMEAIMPEKVVNGVRHLEQGVAQAIDYVTMIHHATPILKASLIFIGLYFGYKLISSISQDIARLLQSFRTVVSGFITSNPVVSVLSDFLDLISPRLTKTADPQGGPAIVLLAGGMAALAPSKEPLMTRMARALAMLGPLAIGVGVLTTSSMWLIEKFPPLFRDYTFSLLGLDLEYQFSSDIRRAIQDATEVSISWNSVNRDAYDFELAHRVVTAYNRLVGLRSSEYCFKKNNFVSKPVDDLLRQLEPAMRNSLTMLGPAKLASPQFACTCPVLPRSASRPWSHSLRPICFRTSIATTWSILRTPPCAFGISTKNNRSCSSTTMPHVLARLPPISMPLFSP